MTSFQIIQSQPNVAVLPVGAALTAGQVPDLVSFEHSQGAANASWVITHNLGFYPSVTIIDSGGNLVEGELTHNSKNQLTIDLSIAISGTAYLS